MATGPERVQAALHEVGVDVKAVRLSESTRTAVDAARAVGCEIGAIAKSLLFLADGKPLLVICSGDRRVDTDKVAGLVGAATLKMAPAEDVKRITGYAIGGVPPLGHATPIDKLMDNRLLSWPLIYAAAGAHDALFPIEPDVLARVSEATLADVTSDSA